MKRIPLRARDGSVRAYAVVDDEDYEMLSRWRWSLHSQGYAVRVCAGNHSVLMHRQIAEAMGVEQVHHDDDDKLNNCRANLKPMSVVSHNDIHHTGREHRVSPERGVHYVKATGKWRAVLRRRVIGRFDTRDEAIQARREAMANAAS